MTAGRQSPSVLPVQETAGSLGRGAGEESARVCLFVL